MTFGQIVQPFQRPTMVAPVIELSDELFDLLDKLLDLSEKLFNLFKDQL
jgi:hypothetical protein